MAAEGGYDGHVRIGTKIDQTGFNTGVKTMQLRMISFRATMKAVFATIPLIAKTALRVAAETIRNFGALAGNILKKALVGGLLFFALSFQKIIQSVRESMGELINARGGTLKKDIEDIRNKFIELRAGVAAAFLPLIELAIPYIKMAVDWLIKAVNWVGMVTAAFAGQKQVLQVVTGSSAKYAKNTKDAEKAAKGALAAFDQINVLQRDTAAQEAVTPKTVDTQMVPITDDILAKVQAIKDEIAEWFADPIGKLQETWGKVSDWFQAEVADPIQKSWSDFWADPKKQGDLVASAIAAFTPFPAWFLENVIMPLKPLFADLWAVITNDNLTTAEKFKAAWVIVKDFFKTNVIDPLIESIVFWAAVARLKWQEFVDWFRVNIAAPVKEAFNNALDAIGQKFQDVFTRVQTFVDRIVDNILASVTRMINGILEGMAAITGLQAPTIPNVGGAKATVPHLATGAVIPPNSKFLAMLGDQKSGINVEAPLDTIKQAVSEVMGGGGFGGGDITVMLDGEVIYKNQMRVQRRHGKSLLAGG